MPSKCLLNHWIVMINRGPQLDFLRRFWLYKRMYTFDDGLKINFGSQACSDRGRLFLSSLNFTSSFKVVEK